MRLAQTEAYEQVARGGYLEPGPGARLGPLGAAREAAPATELREGVPTRLSGRSGTKPLAPGGGALLFEGEVPAGGEPGETPVGAVGDDGAHVGQLGQPVGKQLASRPDVVRPRRVDSWSTR